MHRFWYHYATAHVSSPLFSPHSTSISSDRYLRGIQNAYTSPTTDTLMPSFALPQFHPQAPTNTARFYRLGCQTTPAPMSALSVGAADELYEIELAEAVSRAESRTSLPWLPYTSAEGLFSPSSASSRDIIGPEYTIADHTSGCAPIISAGDIAMNSPEPINITGHSCDLFVGQHITVGKVALKRLRTAENNAREADAIRVGTWVGSSLPIST